MALCPAHAASCILMHQEYQHGQSSVIRNAGAWAAHLQLHGRIQDTTSSRYVVPALQMAAPTHQLPPTPPGVGAASTGAVAFQSWLADEEEEWRLSQRLEASCPKEFKCPISLDIMQDPIILVRPVHQQAHRGYLCSAEAGTLSIVLHSESPSGCIRMDEDLQATEQRKAEQFE